ncbi:MAG: glycine cleavage system protein [Acidobacteria bacterium]|nr:glycine cleavage system protein [Acidobacteriota bacterium]
MAQDLRITIDKFTFTVEPSRMYTADGVWMQDLGGGRVRLGVSDFVQQHSGDVAFATVKAAGTAIAAGDEFAALETVKANVSLLLPFAGTIAEVNPALDATPEVVNRTPYGEGWLAVVLATGWDAQAPGLLDGPAYLAVMTSQAEQELNQP